MSIYLKKAVKTAQTEDRETRAIAAAMLQEIRECGEAAVRKYAADLDHWTQDLRVTEEEVARRIRDIPQTVKDDFDFARDQVFNFAIQQRESLREFSVELFPGVRLGQKLIPCRCAGCYVPGGRFAHAASAIMSIATARAAGVSQVVACSPARDAQGINPYVLYAMSICRPDVILTLGGVQAIATLAYGLFTGMPADIIVGPGNRFVAEAKRLLYGEVGIDVFAGPSESLILADRQADPLIVAVDLMSQAEHGFDSPVWLVTDSRELAEAVIGWMPRLIRDLPDPKVTASCWEDYGEVILCRDREEMAAVADNLAVEHVQVQTADTDWWLERLKNYGSLFLGEGSTVTYGDKTAGTNHILPTKRAARYSGGLSVGKFIKTVTYQEVSRSANRRIGAVASRISRLEGMEGHARAADVRLRKYFPDEDFGFEVYRPRT
jgi:sulfopropanediol 3-dehydrogenase